MITRAIIEAFCYVVTIAAAIVGIVLSLALQALGGFACAVAWPFGVAREVGEFFGELHARVLVGWERGVVP